MLGAGLLWFGWFGFNAGSALGGERHRRSLAFINTRSPPPPRCSAGSLVEKMRDGHATTLGAASGAVAGLVAITPAVRVRRRLVGAIVLGAGRRCGLRLRGRPEVPVRLRRLARRRRRPPRRRHRRHARSSASSPTDERRPVPGRRQTACSTAAASTSCWAGRSSAAGSVLLYSLRRRRSSSATSSTRRSASGSTDEAEVERHRPRPARSRPRTRSSLVRGFRPTAPRRRRQSER